MKPGERIRYFRKNKGLTQAEFAEKLGFSDAYLSEIETGKKDPSGEILDKLETVFGIPREYLLYSGTHAQWEKIEADLKAQGLDDVILEKIKPHYLAALVLCGKEEFQRGFNRGMIAHDPQAEYKTLAPSRRKLLDDVREIFKNGPPDIVTALEANIKAFLGATRAAWEKRACSRFLLNVPIDFQIMDEPDARSGIIVNANQMGFLIQTPHDMPIGKRINLRVSLFKDDGAEAFRGKGEIIWKDKKRADEAEEYQYGIKLIEILNEGHVKLESLIRGHDEKESE